MIIVHMPKPIQKVIKRLTDHVVNAFYTPVEHVDLGVEYHHGKRENFAGKEADISRVNMSARYKF